MDRINVLQKQSFKKNLLYSFFAVLFFIGPGVLACVSLLYWFSINR